MNTLSAYELACGYVERFEHDNLWVTLWREHGVYHVRAHEFNGRGRLAWSVFSTLTAARRYHRRMVKMLTPRDGGE